MLQIVVRKFATVASREIRHWGDGVESGALLHDILVVIPGEKSCSTKREIGMAEFKTESCHIFVSREWVILKHRESLVT
ncbi:hypothetical protein [Haladaptatus halobius]|uniref:hypothetical protein n=1 Tax=Haladaptatus halobius TaxID=2884875 RepID=UPI001D0B5654|nr:hypothetical protein [Haladaptatus halobius]